MKGSKLLLVFVFIVTIVLGIGAVWIGLRLSKEEQTQPETKITTTTSVEKLPDTGTGRLCIYNGDSEFHDLCGADHQDPPYYNGNDLQFSATHSFDEATQSVVICTSVTNRSDSGKTYTLPYWNSNYCPRRGTNPFCDIQSFHDHCENANTPECMAYWGCHENGERNNTPISLAPGQSTGPLCRNIPKTAECGLVQWDIGVNNCGENDQGDPILPNGYFGYLYYLGTNACPLYCNDLTANPTVISSLDGGTIDLTTSIETEYVSELDYTYGNDLSGTSIPGGRDVANTTWYIPAGTSAGSYTAWVSVDGRVILDTHSIPPYVDVQASGCTGKDQCTPEGSGCQVPIEVRQTTTTSTPTSTTTTTQPEGTCDCESIQRSPSGDDLLPGTYVTYILTAEDQNGDPCIPDVVEWEVTSGSLTEIDSGSNGGSQHWIIYQIPAGAESGTEICVEGTVDNNPVTSGCSDCFSIGEQELPAFAAVKTAQIECINDNTAARVTYTIHVRNISDVEGVIEYVEDTYDSRFQSSWISNITPTPDSHNGNVIRWDNNNGGYTLAANDGASGGEDEIEFSYIVTVPSEYFGTYENGEFEPYKYRNFAIVKPEEQEQIELRTVVEITCLVPTGLLDNAITSALVGLFLITLGGVVYRFRWELYGYLAPVDDTVIAGARGVDRALNRMLYVMDRIGGGFVKLGSMIVKIVGIKVRDAKVDLYEKTHLTKEERFENKSIREADRRRN
ncbi:MAG: hypothetical protein PHS44_04640 [Candidatus Dojkabacteria bacterium]|nr:hypothetical protein [Candidatus Dojkabacteria bacterium]